MTAEQMWQASGLTGEYKPLKFGGNTDEFAGWVRDGIKTTTTGPVAVFRAKGIPLFEEGQYRVVLDSADEAVCIIRFDSVVITTFDEVTPEHAYGENVGDRSLAAWKEDHRAAFTRSLAAVGAEFTPDMEVMCVGFSVVWK